MSVIEGSSQKLDPSSFHRLTYVDTATKTARCLQCGPTSIRSRGRSYSGWGCSNAYNRRRKRSGYRKHLKAKCELCPFTGHSCQRDIHHIDGNRENDAEENLLTVCANCHRLITYFESIGMELQAVLGFLRTADKAS